MIPKILHQVFLGFDTPNISDIPIYSKCQKQTKKCLKCLKWKYKLWTNQDCENLVENVYPEFIDLWNDDFTQPIMKADFIRYLILHHEGGIYLDLDMYPIKNFDSLLDKSEIFTTWHDDTRKLPYNALLGSRKNNPLFMEIANHSKISFYEKSKTLPSSWKGRLVFHSTGHYMLKRVLKRHNIIPDDLLRIYKKGYTIEGDNPFFADFNASIWYNGAL